MKFKGILLDLDNTIYDYNTAHETALDKVFTLLEQKFSIDRSSLNKSFNAARKIVATNLARTAASHNRMLYFQKMLELLHLNSSHNTLRLYETYWSTFLKNMIFYPGALDFLQHIQKYKICIVTDLTAHIQHRKIKRLGIEKYIDFLVTSEEAGIEKPHPKIFSIALKKLKLEPSDVCMIGDNLTKDIYGAVNLTIKSFWYNPRKLPIESQSNKISVVSHFESLKNIFLTYERVHGS